MPTTTPIPPVSASPLPPLQTGAVQFDPTKLADIHLPESIGFWPIAPGWWILSALIIIAAVILFFFNKAKPEQSLPSLKKLRSQAMQELMNINKAYESHGIPHKMAKQLSIFLRRYALSLYPRDDVAALTDAQWLGLLDKMSGTLSGEHSKTRMFSQKFSDLLTKVPYQSANVPVDTELLLQLFELSKKMVETNSLNFSQKIPPTAPPQLTKQRESEHV